MSLQTQTTGQIKDNIIAQLETDLNQNIPLLPKAFNRVLAMVMAGVFVLLWKYASSIFLQMFVSQASNKPTTINGKVITPLKEWGRLVDVEQTAATKAEFNIDISVNTQSGSIVSGTPVLNLATGVTYITIGDVLLNAPVVSALLRAAGDQSGGDGSGAQGNVDTGTILSFVATPPNVQQDITVTTIVVTAANEETTEAFRQRILDRFAKRPQGGAYADYEQWGEEVEGIINVYPYSGGAIAASGPGQIDLFSEATEASSGSPDGIPTAQQLLDVKESVELNESGIATRRPVNAFINSEPIKRTAFDIEIFGFTSDNVTEVQQLIIDSVTAYLWEREPFIPGLSLLPRLDSVTQAESAGVAAQVAAANNSIFSGFTIKEGATAFSIRQLEEGEKAKLGTATFS